MRGLCELVAVWAERAPNATGKLGRRRAAVMPKPEDLPVACHSATSKLAGEQKQVPLGIGRHLFLCCANSAERKGRCFFMEQKKWWQKKGIFIGLAVLVVVIVGMVLIWRQFAPSAAEGQKTIAVQVVHKDESVKNFEIATDEEFLRGALEQENLIQGEESEYGLFVKTVDGETVEGKNQEWWCFTKGGEMVNTGVDSTPIADGESYEITFKVGY